MSLCGPQDIEAKYKYLALYEFETDDPNAVLKEVRVRSGAELMRVAPSLVEALTLLYENRS